MGRLNQLALRLLARVWVWLGLMMALLALRAWARLSLRLAVCFRPRALLALLRLHSLVLPPGWLCWWARSRLRARRKATRSVRARGSCALLRCTTRGHYSTGQPLQALPGVAAGASVAPGAGAAGVSVELGASSAHVSTQARR